MTNVSDEDVVIASPEIDPLSGTIGYKNTIQIRNNKGELLDMVGAHVDYVKRPMLLLKHSKILGLNFRSWFFALENYFPDLVEAGEYTIEFRLISPKTMAYDHAPWSGGMVDLVVSINKSGPYKYAHNMDKYLDVARRK